jgi:hypothetical protein
VDFIFGVDSSADTQNWPNGTAYVATYEKFMLNATSDVVFPYIPDQQTYITLYLTLKLNSGSSILDLILDQRSSAAMPVIILHSVEYLPW